jgi:hypothetical protein
MDLGAYIPYIQSSREEMDRRAAHFEESFVQYATAQLIWVVQNLTTEIRLGEKSIIVPVGDSKAFLKVAIVLTKASADDLENSLWASRFECAITALRILNLEEITPYDQGNKEIYDNEKQAVDRITRKINAIVGRLSLQSSCN